MHALSVMDAAMVDGAELIVGARIDNFPTCVVC